MTLSGVLLCFLLGGAATAIVASLEAGNHRTLSGFAALVPVITMVSYLFIGASKNSFAVSQHAKFVLFGTLFSWVPYMLVIAYASTHIGANKAIGLGSLVFLATALIFIWAVQRYQFFQ
ncbi:MAG: hypothetical protein NTV34_03580 [Proteobacteria bacterium]|nr:hypothetical protein [Pseudomonadota bacterium]